jgi:hypothetical protein
MSLAVRARCRRHCATAQRIAVIDKELDARDTGLFRDHEMLEFRIGRLVTRWHLGERLAKMERAPGPGQGVAGPGRGKKLAKGLASFRGLIDRLKITDPVALARHRDCPAHDDSLTFAVA